MVGEVSGAWAYAMHGSVGPCLPFWVLCVHRCLVSVAEVCLKSFNPHTAHRQCNVCLLAPAGQCLALFAPGSSITSTSWKSDTATSLMSGTSMATVCTCMCVQLVQVQFRSA